MRQQILADWICFTAETDVWWVCWRPWSTRGMSWVDWHLARFDATGDADELIRAARHVDIGPPG